jgi:hypothetical protein
MRAGQPLTVLAVCALGALLVLGACATTGALTYGERLSRAKCGACHVRPTPTRLAPDAWPALLDAHRERVPLGDEERAALLAYLAQRATVTPPTP